MQFSLRALFLAILSVSISALWASNSQAEYWSHPFIGKCRDSGFACARKVSIAVYGADQTFSRCNYIRADYYGYLVMAECKGSRGWGMVNLNCESGEVKSTNGCISAPIVDKDPPCESQAGNPVDASSGMKLEYVLDFTTAGPLPLKFERHYRSETNTRDGEYKTSRLGTGWRSNFDGAMFYYSTSSHPSSSLRFVLPDGTFYSFKTSNGAYVQRYYSWTKKEWVNQSVNRSAKAAWNSSAQRYELTTPDDTLWSFDTSARLRSITYRGGYAQVLDYDSSGNNTSVTDSFGRSLTFTYSSKGLLQTMRTPDGMTYAYGYAIRYFEDYAPYLSESSTEAAEFFALKSVTYPSGLSRQYHYENGAYPFALTGITDERGVRYATFAYDDDGRVTRSEHVDGNDAHQFAYDDTALTTTVVNPLGKQSVYHFESDVQSLKRLKRLEGKPSANCLASDGYFTRNSSNYITERIDDEGRVTKFTRDSRGNPTQIIEAYGTADQRTTTITWHSSFSLPTKIAKTGLTIELAYDASGRLVTRKEIDTTTHTIPYATAGETRVWSYAYSDQGLLLSVDGPLTGSPDTVLYAYDAKGYIASTTDEAGLTTNVTAVNGAGFPTTIVDPNGVTHALVYDELNRVVSSTVDPGGEAESATRITYDALGQITRVTLGDGSYLNYTYDDAHRVIKIANALGEEIAISHDLMGNVLSADTRSGSTIVQSMSLAYDELGRLLRSLGTLGQTTSYAYDRLGELTSLTDPRNAVYGYAYDALGRIIRETDPEGATVSLTLDSQDEVKELTDPIAVTTSFIRNGFGEIIQESSPDIGTIVYRRNALGDVTERTDARGVTSAFTFDEAGRLVAKTFDSSPEQSIRFDYDELTASSYGSDRLTEMTDASGTTAIAWTKRGEVASLSSAIGGRSYAASFSYDRASRISSITYPSGREVAYARDAQGQVISIMTRSGASSVFAPVWSDIAWQPFGPFSGASLSSGLALDHEFNTDGELTRVRLASGVGVLMDRSYVRGDLVNITGIDDIGTENDQTYAYSRASRLSTASGAWGTDSYAYDAVGNRLSFTRDISGSSFTSAYSYGPLSSRINSVSLAGEAARAFVHDAAGNIIEDVRGGHVYRYGYDANDRLASVTRDDVLWATYLYNGFGQLAARELTAATGTPGTIHYSYDRDGRLIAETDAASGVTLREYIWLEDLPVAVIDGTGLYHVVTDHLYRPVALFDSSGAEVWSAVWEPFGALYSLNGSVNLDARFPGQWYQLETGLHYNWHRHYDPTLGRYTQADPVGMPDVPNRFAYARSNPMMNIDPDGKQVALPIPGPGIPLPLPPVFIPGSPENEQFTKNTLGGLQKIIQLCRRSLGFGGGNDNDEPDCHDRYEREMQSCHKRRWKMAHPHYFNGCLDRAADRRSQCIRNGGRPAPGELSEWSDADEETWINPFK